MITTRFAQRHNYRRWFYLGTKHNIPNLREPRPNTRSIYQLVVALGDKYITLNVLPKSHSQEIVIIGGHHISNLLEITTIYKGAHWSIKLIHRRATTTSSTPTCVIATHKVLASLSTCSVYFQIQFVLFELVFKDNSFNNVEALIVWTCVIYHVAPMHTN